MTRSGVKARPTSPSLYDPIRAHTRHNATQDDGRCGSPAVYNPSIVEDRLPDADLLEAITLAGRRMLLDAKPNAARRVLAEVLSDPDDARDALRLAKREKKAVLRWV